MFDHFSHVFAGVQNMSRIFNAFQNAQDHRRGQLETQGLVPKVTKATVGKLSRSAKSTSKVPVSQKRQ
jgi:hypothetical protein